MCLRVGAGSGVQAYGSVCNRKQRVRTDLKNQSMRSSKVGEFRRAAGSGLPELAAGRIRAADKDFAVCNSIMGHSCGSDISFFAGYGYRLGGRPNRTRRKRRLGNRLCSKPTSV